MRNKVEVRHPESDLHVTVTGVFRCVCSGPFSVWKQKARHVCMHGGRPAGTFRTEYRRMQVSYVLGRVLNPMNSQNPYPSPFPHLLRYITVGNKYITVRGGLEEKCRGCDVFIPLVVLRISLHSLPKKVALTFVRQEASPKVVRLQTFKTRLDYTSTAMTGFL